MDDQPQPELVVRRDADLATFRSTLHVAGEVHAATAPCLRAALTQEVASGCDHLVVDLTATGLVTAAGIHELLVVHRCLVDRGSRPLTLVGPNRVVRRVIDVCGLGRLVDDDRAAAADDRTTASSVGRTRSASS